MSGIACKINLIEFNPHVGTQFLPSFREDVLAFRSILIQVAVRRKSDLVELY